MTPENTEHWRAAFETWAATEYGNDDDDSGVSLERRGDGYAYSGVDDAWQGWKGALLSASKPASPAQSETREQMRARVHRKLLAMPDNPNELIGPLDAPAQSAKPVMWVILDRDGDLIAQSMTEIKGLDWQPLYAAPPEQTERALTDERIHEIASSYMEMNADVYVSFLPSNLDKFARALLAAARPASGGE